MQTQGFSYIDAGEHMAGILADMLSVLPKAPSGGTILAKDYVVRAINLIT
jgi:hypothetical protein